MRSTEDFHALNPRILYGFALDDAWRVDTLRVLEVGEFVEVVGLNGMVMAQGRVTSVSQSEYDGHRHTITMATVTTLDILEAATCDMRR